jgi:hypothetical protein
MGQTDGRDEKTMQKKTGKRPKRFKEAKEIEGNYFFVVFDENRASVCVRACVCVCVCECLVLHIQQSPPPQQPNFSLFFFLQKIPLKLFFHVKVFLVRHRPISGFL